jgi:hypothetical protein
MLRRSAASLTLGALALIASMTSARAQEAPPPAPAGPPPADGSQTPPSTQLPSFGFSGSKGLSAPISGVEGKSIGAGIGFGQIGDDYYARINLGFELNLGKLGVGVQAPLNVLVYEGDGPGKFDQDAMHPESSRTLKTYGSTLRRSDYDEIGDYGKFIRYVRWGHKGDPLHLQVGELGGMSIGHGTIVGRYMNNVSLDHTKFGLVADVDTEWGGVETLFDNLVSEGDKDDYYGGESFGLVAGRAYVRPLNGTALPFVRRTKVGLTYAVDRRAPIALALDPTTGGVLLDREGNFVKNAMTSDDSFKAYGFDVEVPVLESSILSVIPYVDYNMMSDIKAAGPPIGMSVVPPQVSAGSGLHIGTMVGFRFPILLDITLSSRLEYRYLGQQYLPAYFDGSYDLQRYQYPLNVDGSRCGALKGVFDTKGGTCFLPKATALGQLTEAKNGIYGEVAFKFMSLLTVGGGLEDYDGPLNGAINLYATLPALKDFLSLTAFYQRRAIDITQEAFDLDERTLLGANARFKLSGPLWLVGMFTRQYARDPASPDKISNVDNYNFGLEFSMPL